MEIKNYNKTKNIFQNKNQIIQKDKVDTQKMIFINYF